MTSWLPETFSSYEGVYHFGFSEDESDLLLIVDGANVYAQLWKGEFADDGLNWQLTYQNFSKASIREGEFLADGIKGKFVQFPFEGIERFGLHIYTPWSALITDATTEVGMKQMELKDVISGEFPQASTELLSIEALRTFSSDQLRIMRNEIFARYGYRFREGGQMEEYFMGQNWYKPDFDNVNAFLTELEKTKHPAHPAGGAREEMSNFFFASLCPSGQFYDF